MFKNQLQELAQRSCFNLPSYACIREGPDHAPRFKASVNFNGEIFGSPSYCTTLRQAEHAAAEVALNVLSSRGPSRSLTARILDETGIYKNLLQETAHRAGLNLPVYTTVRSGPGHVPTFTCTVELAGMNFTGDPARTKKQAEKNAAIAAWSALKRMPNLNSLTNNEEQDRTVVGRVPSNFKSEDEYKQARRREYSQSRRRMVKGYRENSSTTSSSSSPSPSPSSSTPNSTLRHQHWKLLDFSLDSAIDGSAQKQNSFVSLLPPPPPRTTSKILPPTSVTENYCAYPSSGRLPKGKQQVKLPEIPIPVEEHQKDEEEWLGSGSSVANSSNVHVSSSIYRPFPLSKTTQQESTHISSRIFGSPNPPSISRIDMASTRSPLYAHKIAPAVQIRSVIPVCAAPPAVRPPSVSVVDPSSAPSKSTQTGAAEVSMVNKTESHPTQLSTELNKKLQL